MKYLFAVAIILGLLSCIKDEEHCWSCEQTVIVYPNWCQDNDTTVTQYDVCGMTEQDIELYQKFYSYNTVKQLDHKMALTYVSSMLCKKYTCPE